MSDGAIFGSTYELGLWEELDKADSNKNAEKRGAALAKCLNKVLSDDDETDSRILCRFIRIISAEEAEGWAEDVRDLVGKKRPRDCRPVLTAALCLARKGMITDAEAYVESLGEAPDKAFYNYVKAEIEIARENTHDAFNYLILALCSDRLNHDVYVLLGQIDNRINWSALEACERMAKGLDFVDPADGGEPEMDLFRIYREWFYGSRDTATRMLIASPGYTDKVPAYCVLSARMSQGEKDWKSCQMMLEEACRANENDMDLLCELGEAYLRGGEPDGALARFRNAEAYDIGNPRVVRGMIESCMKLGKNSEAQQCIREFFDSEMVTFDDYEKLSLALLDMGFNEDAVNAAERMLDNEPGNAVACIVMSKAAVAEGDLRAAERYAKDGISHNKKNPDSLAQLARVHMALRHPAKAASVAKRAVSADKSSLNALTTLMDVYRETGENDRAVEVCRSILDLDPDNREAADMLSNLELVNALQNGSNSDDINTNSVGSEEFILLITTLLEDGKYTEVQKLCKDNEHKFDTPEIRRLRGNAEYALGEYINASQSFASAAVLSKNDAEIWHSKGLADEKFGDLDSAEEAYGKAILLDMYNADYWISNGCVKEKKGDLDAAVKSFNRAIELNPRSAYALVRKAAIFASNGMFSEALNFLDLAEVTEPKNTDILVVKMKVCLKAARYTDAVFLGKRLMKKDPAPTTVATYARANLGLDDTTTAKKVLNKALASDPDNLELLAAYRDLYIQLGDNDEIISVCKDILKLQPYDKVTKKALAEALLGSGKSDEANMIYSSIGSESADEKSPSTQESEDPAAMFNIAKSMFEAGDLVSAARLTDRAMEADPDNLDYNLFRATIYRKNGDKRVADMFLSQYLERNPTNGAVYEAIGDMRQEDGDLKGASEAYGEAINTGIQKPILYVKLGTVQERMGAKTAAVNSYNTAVMLNPHDAEACRYLAYMQLKTGDTDSALRSIKNSITAGATGEAYAILAMIYQDKKDRDGVRDAYQGFLRFDNVPDEWTARVITALNSVGLRTEASILKSHPGFGSDPEEVQGRGSVTPEVKRCAERIMRRAYMMGSDITDPGIADGVDSDTGLVHDALLYLAEIPNYGEVLYGTNECEHLEGLSYQVVFRGKNKDLEVLTVETAYVAGGAKDVDEAKLLLSYIRAARTSRLPREIPKRFQDLGASTAKGKCIEEIMLDNKIGVFSARMVQSCIGEK